MQLGIVLTDEQLLSHAIGLATAAQQRTWNVRCFLTDRGVMGLADDSLAAMIRAGSLPTAVCELSVERYAEQVPHEFLTAGQIQVGGQYRNAEMVKHCDVTVVL